MSRLDEHKRGFLQPAFYAGRCRFGVESAGNKSVFAGHQASVIPAAGARMQIYINGVERQIPDQTTMRALVESLELGDQRFAIEVNEELVPRSTFDAHRLSQGDRIEVVQAIGGG